MKKLIRSTSGFSMVEGLIAAGIVAVSVLAIGVVVAQHNKTMRSARAKQEVPGVSTDVLNRARSILLETRNPANNRRERGICKILRPEAIRPGTVPVRLVYGETFADRGDWDEAFSPDWQITSYRTNTRGGVDLNLVPIIEKNSIVSSNTIDPKTMNVKLTIDLRSLDPDSSDRVFVPITGGTDIDAKRGVYMIEAETSYDQILEDGKRQRREAFAKDLVSVVDVGACDIVHDGKTYLLSPAGTGLGDPAGRTIYNLTEFGTKADKIFDTSFSANEVTQGKYEKGRLAGDRRFNVVAACSEERFRCPKAGGNRAFRNDINIVANISFNANNKYSNGEDYARFAPTFKLVDEAGNDTSSRYGLRMSYTSARAQRFDRRNEDGLYYRIGENGNMIVNVDNSLHVDRQTPARLFVTVSNAEGMCRSACNVDNPAFLKPELELKTPDYPRVAPWVSESVGAEALHCTMCYVKGCTRMGLETFGPINEMPPEPLDAQIPECAAQETAENQKIMPFAGTPVSGAAGDCISARVDAGKIVYQRRNCGESLPVMCFAFGQYTFARNLGVSKPHPVRYDRAMEACRNLGRESHPTQTLSEGISRTGGSVSNLSRIPASEGRYRFLNLAKVGTFVGPQGESEEKQVVAGTFRVKEEDRPQEFWVGLRYQNGTMVAETPEAVITNSADEQHLLYYSAAGVQTHQMVTSTPYDFVANAPSNPDEVGHVLFNHVKFRGIVSTAKTQTSSLSFLCMKQGNHAFFLSNRTSRDFDDGGSTCENEGGLFVAPHTPMAWMQSLLLVDDHGAYTPFPELTPSPRRVWVALETPSRKPAMLGEFKKLGFEPEAPFPKPMDWKLSEQYVNRHGVFVQEEDTMMVNPKPAGWKTGDPLPSPKLIPNPAVKIKRACYNPSMKTMTLRLASVGCQGNETRVSKGNIRDPLISLMWVLNKDNFQLGNLEFIDIN